MRAADVKNYHSNMKNSSCGMTLIELMVSVAIVAVVASLAVPSFRTMLVKRSVQSAADSLVSDMRLARSEALKRSTRTAICRSTDGTSCSSVVGSWNEGWIVFIDKNANSSVDTGDEIIRVQQALPNINSIRGPAGADPIQIVKYDPAGFAKAANQSFVFTPTGTVPDGTTRLVCISIQGRPALRAEGTTSC